MVSKTKTKARKKGKQTKGSKKSKSTLRKKSGVKKTKHRKTSPAVARTRKASQKPKKTTTISNTISPFTEETKLLKEQSTEDTTPQIQEESVPEVSQDRADEEISSPSTANTGEDVEYENNTITETT